MDLAHQLSRGMVVYNGEATTMEHGGELRQERVRRCGLPSWNSGQWGTSGVAGVTVVLLRWQVSWATARCSATMAESGAAGARRLRLRVLRTAKEERESETEGTDGSGRVLA